MRPVSRARSEAPGSRQGRTLGTSDCNRRNAIELWHAKQRQPLQRAAAPTPRGASSTTGAGREKSGRRPAFPVAPARRQRELLPLQPGAENPGQLPLERRHATRPVTRAAGAAFEPARWSKRACNCGRLHETGAVQIGRAPRSTSSLQSASRRWPHRRPRRRSRPRPRPRCPPFCRLARWKAQLSR